MDDPYDALGNCEEIDYDALEEYHPCSICYRLIGDEVGYGDTWDGRWVCDQCAGNEDEDET
jgi:hypothetical protein